MKRCLFSVVTISLVTFAISGCSNIWKVRSFADTAVSISHQLDLEALRQAEIERQRLRSARCYSPLLTPAALSAAAEDVDLGANWIEELLRDCPQFSAFLSNLVVSRAARTGITLP